MYISKKKEKGSSNKKNLYFYLEIINSKSKPSLIQASRFNKLLSIDTDIVYEDFTESIQERLQPLGCNMN